MEISKITLQATSSNMIPDILKINIIISITLHLVQNNLLKFIKQFVLKWDCTYLRQFLICAFKHLSLLLQPVVPGKLWRQFSQNVSCVCKTAHGPFLVYPLKQALCSDDGCLMLTLYFPVLFLGGDFLKTKTFSCLIRKQKEMFHSNLVLSIAKQHHTIAGANIPICSKKIWLKFLLKLVLKSKISRYLNSYLVLYLLTL